MCETITSIFIFQTLYNYKKRLGKVRQLSIVCDLFCVTILIPDMYMFMLDDV